MAEITITAVERLGHGGPSISTRHEASIVDGESNPQLRLVLGDCRIKVWPADAERIEDLGNQLLDIAKTLKGES